MNNPVEGSSNNPVIERFMRMIDIPVVNSDSVSRQKVPIDIPARERADQFLTSIAVVAEMKAGNDTVDDFEPDPKLVEQITTLWDQDDVRTAVGAHLGMRRQGRWRGSLQKRYRDLERAEMGTEGGDRGIQAEYEELRRDLYLGKISRPDSKLAAEAELKVLAKKLTGIRQARTDLLTLAPEQLIPEITDFVARMKWENIKNYQTQLTAEGFVWLPSRSDIHRMNVASLEGGRWPLLIGEAGTGKSVLATAAARTLTGKNPVFYPCTPQTGARDLLIDREVDQKGSYYVYGPLVQAFTGYENSRQDAPEHPEARFVVLDESTFLTSPAYALIKEARLKRPANGASSSSASGNKSYYGHPILKGAAAVLTTNPPGVRYKGRTPLDVALSREFAFINVDYPPMTPENPELFEFMLAALMDDRGSINVSRIELSPAYIYEDLRSGATLNGLVVKGTNKLVEDPTDPRHGVLYRFSFACKAIQDSFVLGNNIDLLSDSSLRFISDKDGVKIDPTGDPLTLSRATITLKDISDMLSSFYSRRLIDDPDYHVDSLSEWLTSSINNYILSLEDPLDKDKVRAIFEHYNIFQTTNLPANDFPLTAVDIGYLSPAVPRPLILEEAINPMVGGLKYSFVTVEHEEVTITPNFTLEREDESIHLKYGDAFMLNGEVVIFIGRESDNLEAERLAVRKPNSGLVRMLSAAEVEEVPFFWQADYLKFEKLVVEVGNNNAALKRIGIVQELETTGELGYMYEGQFYKVPTQNEIFELLYPNLEVLDTKASQGFKLPLLVPYLYPVNDYLKLVNDCFAEYSDGSLLRESILETSPISYPLDKPAIIAPSDLTNGLLYHPKGFFSIDKGVNRNTFLKELDSKGFGIVLIEDFISAPAYSSSRKYGGRQQIGSVIYVGDGIKDGRLGFDPSLPEYFAESGMTVPDWLTMVSYYLVTGSAPLHESSEYSNLLLLGNSYRGNDTFCVTFSRLHGQNGYRLGRFKKVGRWVGGDGTDRVLRNVVRAS